LKKDLTVDKFMVRQPYSIEGNSTIANARVIMSDHRIRHLPILENGKVVGILSDRDIALIVGSLKADTAELLARDFGTKEVYEVSPYASLKEVAGVMGKKRIGCAVVTLDARLVGIITTVDICNVLESLL